MNLGNKFSLYALSLPVINHNKLVANRREKKLVFNI